MVLVDPHLGGEENIAARHAGRLDALADLCLVSVGGSRVNVAVAPAECRLDRGLDFMWFRLPGAETDCGHHGACVQGEGLAAWLSAMVESMVVVVDCALTLS